MAGLSAWAQRQKCRRTCALAETVLCLRAFLFSVLGRAVRQDINCQFNWEEDKHEKVSCLAFGRCDVPFHRGMQQRKARSFSGCLCRSQRQRQHRSRKKAPQLVHSVSSYHKLTEPFPEFIHFVLLLSSLSGHFLCDKSGYCIDTNHDHQQHYRRSVGLVGVKSFIGQHVHMHCQGSARAE